MFLATLLLSPIAGAFTFLTTPTGAPMAWQSMPIPYTFEDNGAPPDMSAAGQEAALNEAIGAWTTVDKAEVRFVKEGDSSNSVYWTHDWPFDPEILAMTSNWSTDSGVMIGFTVALNANITDWTLQDAEGRDLQNALTHEMGHVLGLDHNNESLEATMFPTSDPGERKKRDLFWDDEDAIRHLYRVEDVPEFPLPLACSSVAGGGLGSLLLFPLLIALTRRQRSLS